MFSLRCLHLKKSRCTNLALAWVAAPCPWAHPRSVMWPQRRMFAVQNSEENWESSGPTHGGGGQEEKRVKGGRSQRPGSQVGWNGQGTDLIGGMAKGMISESPCEVACVAAIKHPSSPAVLSTLGKVCCSYTWLVWMRSGLSGGQSNGLQTCPNPRDLWLC